MTNERFDTVEDLIHSDLFCEWVQDQKHNTFWQQWQANNPKRQALVIEARAFLTQFSFQKEAASGEEIDAAIKDVWSTIEKQSTTKQSKIIQFSNQRKGSIISMKGLRIAASILFLVFASWLTWENTMNVNTIYATQYGETEKLVLPDGSAVVLQANSTLKVPKNWEEKTARKVWLDGEAFFDVTKLATTTPIKFTVQTDDFEVEVLGTQFNVLNRLQHKRVVLQEGKVQMQLANQEFIELKPNEMVAYSEQQKTYKKSTVQASNFTAWTNNTLVLNNTPLSEIARILTQNYGYEVSFSKSVNQTQTRSTLGVLPINNVEELINLTEASYEVTINKEGKRIKIQ
ncbi:MAG: FecR family protein [Saprospiraceae bacterium]